MAEEGGGGEAEDFDATAKSPPPSPSKPRIASTHVLSGYRREPRYTFGKVAGKKKPTARDLKKSASGEQVGDGGQEQEDGAEAPAETNETNETNETAEMGETAKSEGNETRKGASSPKARTPCSPPMRGAVICTSSRFKDFGKINERHKGVPSASDYNPKMSHTSKSSPSIGFGRSDRMPKLRKDDGPDMYTLPSSFALPEKADCKQKLPGVSMHARTKKEHYEPIKFLEPTAYDSNKGLAVTQKKSPVWNLKTSGNRSTPEDWTSCKTPNEVGPGTYDARFSLVRERTRKMVYHQQKGFTRKPHEEPPDVQYPMSSIFTDYDKA